MPTPEWLAEDKDPVVTRWVFIRAFFQIHIAGTVKPNAPRAPYRSKFLSSGQLILWKVETRNGFFVSHEPSVS